MKTGKFFIHQVAVGLFKIEVRLFQKNSGGTKIIRKFKVKTGQKMIEKNEADHSE